MIATVTLKNRSLKEIVNTEVLVHTNQRGNRLFGAKTHIAPFETRTIDALPVDGTLYDFKTAAHECELEYIVFADGTSWEQPSPL